MVSCSPRLPFKLGDPGSILGRTSTQALKVNEEKMALWEIRSPMSEKFSKVFMLEETGVPVEN